MTPGKYSRLTGAARRPENSSRVQDRARPYEPQRLGADSPGAFSFPALAEDEITSTTAPEANREESVRVSVATNVDEVVRSLVGFSLAATRARSRIVNRLTEQAQVAGLREISRTYGVGPRSFERYVTTRLAREDEAEASISAKGIGLPVYLFEPRPTSKGVSVRIKGRRFVIPHSFVARMTSGRIGVFARGVYGGRGAGGRLTGETFGRFAYIRGSRKVSGTRRDGKGAKRSGLPINELYTFAPADALANQAVVAAMSDRVAEQLDKVARQELNFAFRSGR